ncbi:MAG: hypothetical protein H6518_12420 [Microthrixaceae bacterium]|nr:hypothetical protein [Microthrixaceae bacterium]
MTAHTKHRGGRRLEMMRRRLDLTDEQVATLRERLGEHRRQALAIVRDVLDDEQRARFDAHLERRRGRGRGRRRGHGHGEGHRRRPDPAGDSVSPRADDTADDTVDGPTDAA